MYLDSHCIFNEKIIIHSHLFTWAFVFSTVCLQDYQLVHKWIWVWNCIWFYNYTEKIYLWENDHQHLFWNNQLLQKSKIRPTTTEGVQQIILRGFINSVDYIHRYDNKLCFHGIMNLNLMLNESSALVLFICLKINFPTVKQVCLWVRRWRSQKLLSSNYSILH